MPYNCLIIVFSILCPLYIVDDMDWKKQAMLYFQKVKEFQHGISCGNLDCARKANQSMTNNNSRKTDNYWAKLSCATSLLDKSLETADLGKTRKVGQEIPPDSLISFSLDGLSNI